MCGNELEIAKLSFKTGDAIYLQILSQVWKSFQAFYGSLVSFFNDKCRFCSYAGLESNVQVDCKLVSAVLYVQVELFGQDTGNVR